MAVHVCAIAIGKSQPINNQHVIGELILNFTNESKRNIIAICHDSENAIDEEAFQLLDTDAIKDLIPAIGLRLKFLRAYKEFHQVDQPVPSKDVEAARDRPDRHIPPEGLQEIEENEAIPMSTSEDDEPEERMMPPRKKPMRCKFDIHGILMKMPNGSSLLERLEEKRTANYHDRKVICHALVSYLMEHHGANPPAFIKECLAESLVEELAFLKDRDGITGYEAWYIKGRKGKPASGCLEERLRYVRRKEQSPTNPKKKVQPPKRSSPTTCPKLLQKCHQPIEAVLSDEEEEKLINVLKHTQNTGDIVTLMKQTAKNRHAWIRTSKASVLEILAQYPHLLQPEIVEQDFELTISKDASKRFLVEWPKMTQKILDYVRNVEVPRNWMEKLGCGVEIADLPEDEQQGLALNLLPFLFSGRNKTMRGRCTPEQALRSFIDWKVEGTSVEFYTSSIVNTEHPQSQPFVLLIGGTRWKPLQSFAVVERRVVPCKSVQAAVDIVFKMIFVLDVDYQPHCMAVWQFLEGLVYKLGGSVTAASVLRFRNWLSQQ